MSVKMDQINFGGDILTDRDMANDDSIGSGFMDISPGENSLEIGQAIVSIFVESAGCDTGPVESYFGLPDPHSPRKDGLYRITVSSAQIKPKRVDGSTWDAGEETSRGGEAFIGSLIRFGLKYVPGGQILSPFLGQKSQSVKASHRSQTATAPDPKVRIIADKSVYLTPYVLNTYSPSWDTKFLVTKDSIEGDAIKIELIDQDGTGKETISSELITSKKLFSEEVLRLSFGSVEKLLIQVTKVLEKDEPSTASVKIDKGGSWKKTGIFVIGGQLVQAESKGSYCINAKTCIGVNGSSKTRLPIDESQKTFANAGQVIAVIGEKIYPIGSGASFISESTGELLVGVASKSMASGSAEVDVSVYYPVEKVRPNK